MKHLLLGLLLAGCYQAHERPLVCDGAPEPVGLPHGGFVGLASQFIDGHEGWMLGAHFDEAALDSASPGVEIAAAEGDCVVLRAVGGGRSSQDGGDLEAAVGGAVIATAHFESVSGPYGDASGFSPLPFSAGDVVMITGGGGVTESFAACLTVPPVPTTPLPTVLHAGTPLDITWADAPGADHVELDIAAGVLGGPISNLRCRAPASAGHLEIPGSLSALLPLGRPQITFALQSTRVVAAGDYAVRVIVAQSLSGNITIE